MKVNTACWPVVLASIFIIAANALFVGYRLLLPYPVSAWEAGLVNDAWRMVQGLPVYGAPNERATTMYGPLQMVTLAGLFDLLGPSLQTGRLLSIAAGTTTVLVLAFSFARRDWLTMMVSVALLLAVNGWTAYYFVEARPDMVAVLCTVASLLVLYRGLGAGGLTRQLALGILGSLLMLAGAFFKQTAIIFAVVPLLAESLALSHWRRLLVASLPVVLALAAIALLKTSPALWHFMVEVPAQYRISPTGIAEGAKLLFSLPLFVLAVVHWLFNDARENWRTPMARWLVTAGAIAIASSVPAYAKIGGVHNSLIPGLLAIGAFCSWRASFAIDLLSASTRPAFFRFCTGLVFAMALVMHVFPSPAALSRPTLDSGQGTPEYAAMLEAVRQLPGKVVSFDDPWIALKTKGYAGTVLVFEADAIGWDPERLRIPKELATADYVVAVCCKSVQGGPNWWPKEQTLLAAGFVMVDFVGVSTSAYQLWRRDKR